MNNKLPEFSIILPTYNRVGFIEKAVNSVISQTYDKWELLIIDDGSSDGTWRIQQVSGTLGSKSCFVRGFEP